MAFKRLVIMNVRGCLLPMMFGDQKSNTVRYTFPAVGIYLRGKNGSSCFVPRLLIVMPTLNRPLFQRLKVICCWKSPNCPSYTVSRQVVAEVCGVIPLKVWIITAWVQIMYSPPVPKLNTISMKAGVRQLLWIPVMHLMIGANQI